MYLEEHQQLVSPRQSKSVLLVLVKYLVIQGVLVPEDRVARGTQIED